MVRPPTLNEIREGKPASLWNVNGIEIRDRYEPGEEDYEGTAQVDSEYLLPFYWCALTKDILNQNLEAILTTFRVNGERIPDRYILTYNYDTQSGWKCSYHAVVLGGWARDVQYDIEVRRSISAEINDGESTYTAGDYIYRMQVSVP